MSQKKPKDTSIQTPKVTNVFLLTRVVIFLGISSWLAFAPPEYMLGSLGGVYIGWILLLVFLLHLFFFYFFSTKAQFRSWVNYLFTSLFDVAFITSLVYFTGGIRSDLFLLYYLTISFGAYYLGISGGLAIAFLSTLFYFLINLADLRQIFLGDLALRVLFLWICAGAVGTISKFLKKSEIRFFRTLDMLNERTTELERSQVQIETIYNASLTLGEIHNLDEVVDEVLSIAWKVLGYEMCAVLTRDRKENNLQLKAKVEMGKKIQYTHPPQILQSGTVDSVVRSGKSERSSDIKDQDQNLFGLEGARSELVVPMISQGKVVGVLMAQSKRVGAFLEQDQEIFSILASSAGMALGNAILHQKTEELTIVDELTGIYNYRYFMQKLGDELKRAKRYNLPLSLIMVDIDWFKRCNDSYGHMFGNQVLKDLVEVITKCIRDVDIFVRYGGEEFVVILPQTDKLDAKSIGERIRFQVEATEFLNRETDQKVKITVSLGIASYPENGKDTEGLIQKVDQAMYLAKGKGKNKVCVL